MAMKIRALLSLGVVLISMSLAGCGHYTCGTTFGGGSCSSSGGGIGTGGGGGKGNGLVAYGYFIDYSSHGAPSAGMALQELDATAQKFTALSAFAPPVIPPFPSGMVVVSTKYLYVASTDGTLYSFAIDSGSGNLANIGTNPSAVTGGTSIAASADGKWVFVGDTAGQRVSVFQVNADGTLTGATGNPFATSGVSPKIMATDGLSKYLYATGGAGSLQTAAFSIGTGGVLTPVIGSPFVTNIGSSMVGDPSGKFMIGASYTPGDTSIHVFSVGASNGVLTSWNSTATSQTPRNIRIHPSGQWVYSFGQDPVLANLEAAEGFGFDSNLGILTEMSSSPFSTIIANDGPIDQSGSFMIALGQTKIVNSVDIAAFPVAIDSTDGSLSVWPGNSNQALGYVGIDAAPYVFTDSQ